MRDLLQDMRKQTRKDALIITAFLVIILLWLTILVVFLDTDASDNGTEPVNGAFEDYREKILEGDTSMIGERVNLDISYMGDCFYKGNNQYYYFMPLEGEEGEYYIRICIDEALYKEMDNGNGWNSGVICKVKGTFTLLESWEPRFIENYFKKYNMENKEGASFAEHVNLSDVMAEVAFNVEGKADEEKSVSKVEKGNTLFVIIAISIVMAVFLIIVWGITLLGLPYLSYKRLYRRYDNAQIEELEGDYQSAKKVAENLYIGEKYIFGYVNVFFHFINIVPLDDIIEVRSISKTRRLIYSWYGLQVWKRDGRRTGYGYYRDREIVKRAMEIIVSKNPEVKEKGKNNSL